MIDDSDWDRKADVLMDMADPSPLKLARLGPPAGFTDCACKKKIIPEPEVHYHWTGICHARDTLCRECHQWVPRHALVVCLGCKAVAARIAPQTLKSGFRLESRKVYHTPCCPNCKPDVTKSVIIEAELFYRERNK